MHTPTHSHTNNIALHVYVAENMQTCVQEYGGNPVSVISTRREHEIMEMHAARASGLTLEHDLAAYVLVRQPR